MKVIDILIMFPLIVGVVSLLVLPVWVLYLYWPWEVENVIISILSVWSVVALMWCSYRSTDDWK